MRTQARRTSTEIYIIILKFCSGTDKSLSETMMKTRLGNNTFIRYAKFLNLRGMLEEDKQPCDNDNKMGRLSMYRRFRTTEKGLEFIEVLEKYLGDESPLRGEITNEHYM